MEERLQHLGCHRPPCCLLPAHLAHGHHHLDPRGGDEQRPPDLPPTQAHQAQQQDESKALLGG